MGSLRHYYIFKSPDCLHFFALSVKLPKLAMWVRFPSSAPKSKPEYPYFCGMDIPVFCVLLAFFKPNLDFYFLSVQTAIFTAADRFAARWGHLWGQDLTFKFFFNCMLYQLCYNIYIILLNCQYRPHMFVSLLFSYGDAYS